jgi:serine/threonine-protein kinase
MPIPQFSSLRPDIDERLEKIIQKALRRDRDQRYQSAAEMLHELEVYLYSAGYGPTNEKLGSYTRDLFGVRELQPPVAVSALPRPPEP